MALATRCPHCQTVFRVANDQLKLHAGLVRCGSCYQTFNGVEHLVPATELNPQTPAQSPQVIQPAQPAPISQANQATQAARPAVSVPATSPARAEPGTTAKVTTSPAPAPVAQTMDTVTEAFPPATGTPAKIPAVIAEPLAAAGVMASEAVPPKPVRQMPLPASAPPQVAAPSPVIAPVAAQAPASASSLDFDLGEEEPRTPFKDVEVEALASRVELETRAALSEPDIDWSLADQPEAEGNSLITAPADPSRTEPSLEESAATEKIFADTEPEPASEPAIHASSAHTDPLTGEVEAGFSDEEKPDFILQAEREKKHGRIKRIAMVLAILLMLPLAAAQLAYIFRVQIAAGYPAAKPGLQMLCDALHCDIPLPAQIDQIVIESNELLEQSPGTHIYSLSVQLHNQSTQTQAWPQIELVLNDKKEKALMQRSFGPAEYLDNPADIRKGFAPSSAQNIHLYFDVPRLQAAGYRVAAFYP